MAKSALKFFH